MAKRTQANGTHTNGRPVERAIYVAEDDRARLDALIRRIVDHPGLEATHQYLAALAGELRRARVLPRAEIPRDVVTMNSTVRLRDLETGEDETYTLVYPDDADIEANKISVLAPVGTALRGYRAGDIVEGPVPAGAARLRVEEVLFQPTSARTPARV